MISYEALIVYSIYFILLTTLLIYLDRRRGIPRDVAKLCFKYAVIVTIIRPFFYGGVELVFHTLISWLGIYTGYLINSFYINKKEKA